MKIRIISFLLAMMILSVVAMAVKNAVEKLEDET